MLSTPWNDFLNDTVEVSNTHKEHLLRKLNHKKRCVDTNIEKHRKSVVGLYVNSICIKKLILTFHPSVFPEKLTVMSVAF